MQRPASFYHSSTKYNCISTIPPTVGLFEKSHGAPKLSSSEGGSIPSYELHSKLLTRIRATVSTGACGGAIIGAKEEDKGSNTVKRNNCIGDGIGDGCLAFTMSAYEREVKLIVWPR